MSSLPSFVELMSSLGLEDGASLLWDPSSSPYLRPRFPSNASSSSDLDDEHESSRQQPAFNTGAYLFVSTDYDQRDRASFMESDFPRVSRHGKDRYCPYSVTSVCSCNIIRVPTAVMLMPVGSLDRSRERGAFRHCSMRANQRG